MAGDASAGARTPGLRRVRIVQRSLRRKRSPKTDALNGGRAVHGCQRDPETPTVQMLG
jgi:hypothetical protein